MPDTEHERFMRIALEEARAARAEGNMAVGGVIVRVGQVLQRGHNEAVSTFDVTAHAETVALRRLSTRLRVVNPSYRAGQGPLADCVLYTTVEPCAMCCFAICVSGIAKVVIGARYARMGLRFGDYAIEKLLALLDQPVTIVDGILYEECAALRLESAAGRD
jgi:tRNA(adenine34) deaminase